MKKEELKEKLLDYLYGELTQEEAKLVESELKKEPELLEEFNELKKVLNLIQRVKFEEPSEKLKQNILETIERESSRRLKPLYETEEKPAFLKRFIDFILPQPAFAGTLVGIVVILFLTYVFIEHVGIKKESKLEEQKIEKKERVSQIKQKKSDFVALREEKKPVEQIIEKTVKVESLKKLPEPEKAEIKEFEKEVYKKRLSRISPKSEITAEKPRAAEEREELDLMFAQPPLAKTIDDRDKIREKQVSPAKMDEKIELEESLGKDVGVRAGPVAKSASAKEEGADKENPEFLLKTALNLKNKGNYKSALQLLMKIIKNYPQYSERKKVIKEAKEVAKILKNENILKELEKIK